MTRCSQVLILRLKFRNFLGLTKKKMSAGKVYVTCSRCHVFYVCDYSRVCRDIQQQWTPFLGTGFAHIGMYCRRSHYLLHVQWYSMNNTSIHMVISEREGHKLRNVISVRTFLWLWRLLLYARSVFQVIKQTTSTKLNTVTAVPMCAHGVYQISTHTKEKEKESKRCSRLTICEIYRKRDRRWRCKYTTNWSQLSTVIEDCYRIDHPK